MPDTAGAAELGSKPAPQQAPPPPSADGPDEPYLEALPEEFLNKYYEMRKLQRNNNQRERQLAARGAQIMPHSALQIRFALLLDMVWPVDNPEGASARLELDLRFQRTLAQQWDALESQVSQAMLGAGAQVPPEMLKQMMSQQVPPGLRPR